MAELGVLLALAGIGWIVGRFDDAMSPSDALAASLPLGAAAYVSVMTVLVATRLPVARPAVGLVITAIIAAVLAVTHPSSLRVAPRSLLLWGAGALVVVVVVWGTVTLGGYVSVTGDSLRYVVVAGLLDRFGDLSVGQLGTLWEKRGLATGALHGLAAGDRSFLAGLTPLFAISVLAILWSAIQQSGRAVDRRIALAVGIGALLLLATIERFLFHALYLNSHMLVAAWLLLLQLQVLRMLRSRSLPWGGVVAVLLLSTSIIVARPEGPLLVGLVLLPALVTRDVTVATRRWLALAIALPSIAWPGLGLGAERLAQGEPLRTSVLGLVGLGVVALVLAAAMPLVDRIPRPRATLLWLHGLVWGVLALSAVRDPGILYYSARATFRNISFAGGWGSALLIIALLLVVAFAVVTWPGNRPLAFTLMTFVPLGMMLAYLRDGSFRVGPGDSLNRMLMHLLPIAILALATSAFGELRPRWAASGHRDDT